MLSEMVGEYQEHLVNVINTTNRIEHKHLVFKYKYLSEYSDNSLTGFGTTGVSKLNPESLCRLILKMRNLFLTDRKTSMRVLI